MENKSRLFPMRTVSERTGLSSHVIRAWEKRYDAITPHRTDTNHRLYSQKDIERLSMLRLLTQHGHSIRTVSQLDDEQLQAHIEDLVAPPTPLEVASDTTTLSIQHMLSQCYQAIQDYDRESLEETLLLAQVELSQPQLLEELIGPLLRWVGEGWYNGSLRIAQEHIATAGIRNFLGNIQLMRNMNATLGTMVLATPSEQDHEFGALMASIAAASQGWQCIYLGTRLPPQEIASAVSKTNAAVVVLSITSFEKFAKIQQEITNLCSLLPKDVNIIAGGAGIETHKQYFIDQNIHIVESLNQFSELISERYFQAKN